jgi:hypothetical protein
MNRMAVVEMDLLLAISSHDIEHYLDLRTGAILPIFDGFEDSNPDLEREPQRFTLIEPVPSSLGFRWMEEFADLQAPEVREELLRSLERRRPFRSFKDALLEFEGLREQWYAFEEQRQLAYARDWLRSEGIDAILTTHPAPPGPSPPSYE